MTHVVTEECIGCRYTDCVNVCPTNCFHEGENFLVIDPDECIDCGVCIAECPINAIYFEENLPDDQKDFLEINSKLSRIWPSITKSKPHLLDANKWENVPNKKALIKL